MVISDKDKEYLLSLKPEDLTFSVLVDLFGDKLPPSGDIKQVRRSRFATTDEFTLYPKEYFVKEPTKTTVGRFIYNKYIIERVGLQDILGYENGVITDSYNGKIEAKLSAALIADKMTIEQYVTYIDYRDNLGMQLNSVITTSFTMKTIKTPPEVRKKRDELFKKYDKELSEGDIVTSERIEKELVADAKKILKGDPGMDLYNSEARGNFGNFKNMNLYKGASMNNITGKYEIVRSSFMDGISKQDIPSFATAVVSGAYPKAVGTQESGYLAKQLLAAMQTERLDEPGTDCHTTRTIDLKLTSSNIKDFKYRYIVENGKLIELTPEELTKRIGTTVKLRSPLFCKDPVGSCNICAGNMNYKLNNLNIGLGCSRVAETLKKLGMKKFHVSNLKSKQIDPDDMLI